MRLGVVIVLAALLGAPVARADRTPVAPAQLPHVRQRVPQLRVPVPPPTAGSPPVGPVRAAIQRLGPEVQRCAETHEPWPGAGARPRLRLRVWLEPEGRFTLEVPELAARTEATQPPRVRVNLARLHSCLYAQVARAISGSLRPFRGRRQKIERAFRITTPGPPPSAAELARLVSARRAELLACVPGSGTGDPQELVIQATLAPSGLVELTGLAVPASVRFDLATRCVADAIGGVHAGRVTSPQRFEAVLRYRFSEPTPPPAP